MENNIKDRVLGKTMKKLILSLMLVMLLVSSVSASTSNEPQKSIGTYAQGDCIELLQICGTCTFNNVTSVILPNSTRIILDVVMTRRGAEYNYTFCDTELYGQYLVNGVGDLDGTDNAWAYDFFTTESGIVFDESNANLYIGLIISSWLFLFFAVWGAYVVPFRDQRDSFGKLVSVNYFKWLKVFLIVISYLLLTFNLGTLSAVARQNLFLGGMENLFSYGYNILLFLMWPAILVGVLSIVVIIIRDIKFDLTLRRTIASVR